MLPVFFRYVVVVVVNGMIIEFLNLNLNLNLNI